MGECVVGRHAKRLLCATAVAAVAAFGSSGAATAKEEVRVAGLTWPGYGFWFIVEEKGLAPNLEISYEAIEDPFQSFSLAAAGRVDIVSSTIEFAPIAAEQDMPVRLFAYGNLSNGTDSLVVGPEINEPGDLRGERIAVLEGGLQQLFTGMWLEDNGVGIDEVHFVNLIMDDAVSAMIGGDVAAAQFWEPFGTQALNALPDARGVATTAEDEWREMALIADGHFMTVDMLENRRDTAREAVRAYYEAVAWWRENPEEGNRIIADNLRMSVEDVELVIGADGTGMDGGLYPYSFTETARFCGVEDGDPPFGQTNGQITELFETINEWWIKFGHMQGMADVDTGVDCSLLGELAADGFQSEDSG